MFEAIRALPQRQDALTSGDDIQQNRRRARLNGRERRKAAHQRGNAVRRPVRASCRAAELPGAKGIL
jgi:hypothetical protein